MRVHQPRPRSFGISSLIDFASKRGIRSLAAVLILSSMALAQGSRAGGHPSNPPPPPVRPQDANFDQKRVELQSSGPKGDLPPAERDACLLSPLNALQLPTVKVENLQVSGKAKKQYLSACSALKDSQYEKAEESLRKAVSEEPKYVAAWVTLGQLLAGRQKLDDARDACSRAQSADAAYLPSYLCLADVAARSQNWNETLSMSDRALQIDPANDPFAYDYNAAASLNLHKLDAAERSALKAIEIDHNHIDPRVHFLLAQIYEAKGDRAKEESELREYLKFAGANDAAMVRQYLSQFEAQQK